MNDSNQQNARVHNTVVIILTVASVGAIAESISQGWEFWVPPLIAVGLVAAWIMHILQYRQRNFRENYYLVFSMIVSFYHGVHETSLFDLIVISLLLMITVTLLRRSEFLNILLVEFFLLVIIQIFRGLSAGTLKLDALDISRIALHCIAEICAYAVLHEVVANDVRDTQELERRNEERLTDKEDMEDFLVNISHELRTPVNVINGLSSIILKNEKRDDVASISDAGFRMAQQIEDIQDYGEIQRGDVILEENNYMVSSLINDIIAGYLHFHKEMDKELIVDLDPNVPSVLSGDVRRINRILGHLLENAFKFTHKGGVYLRVKTIGHADSTNLVIEITDTGIGISADEIEKINEGMYQSNRKRNRSTGGIGLGLPIVYGFVRCMKGFVSIDSTKGNGTTVRVSIPQNVIDTTPCLRLKKDTFFNVVYHMDPDNYRDPRIWDFYREMAVNTASVLRINMYFAPTKRDVEELIRRGDITHVFMGEAEYRSDPSFYDRISQKVTVAVSTAGDFVSKNGNVICMPRPLYGYPIVRILNGEAGDLRPSKTVHQRPVLDGVKALVVDDEPLNLIVAEGLFREYNMIVDTALSGSEAIQKYSDNEYDVVFMDHMMPQMDGVEAMKKIKDVALRQQKMTRIIALTANVVSGAREMFMQEGFDGFIGKPIDINEFERTMRSVLPQSNPDAREEGGGS